MTSVMRRNEARELIECEQKRFAEFVGKVRVDVSGGSGSAVAWHRCLTAFSAERVVPVFADTETEDPDLYRFLNDCEKLFGQKLTRLNCGKDIWDVFIESRMMRIMSAGGACKASVELKQKPLDNHFAESDCDAVAVGLGPDEPERMLRIIKRLYPVPVLFPLCAIPELHYCDVGRCIESLGLKPAALYADGFIHNNCGGTCVLAGISQWAAVCKLYPDKFAYAEQREQEFTEATGFTILRDRRGGITRKYPLSELRADVEAGRAFRNDWKSNCSCMLPDLFAGMDDDITREVPE